MSDEINGGLEGGDEGGDGTGGGGIGGDGTGSGGTGSDGTGGDGTGGDGTGGDGTGGDGTGGDGTGGDGENTGPNTVVEGPMDVWYINADGELVYVAVGQGSHNVQADEVYYDLETAMEAYAATQGEGSQVVNTDTSEGPVYYSKTDENGVTTIIRIDNNGDFIIPEGYVPFEDVNPDAVIEGGEDGYVFYRIEGDSVIRVVIAAGEIGYYTGQQYLSEEDAENAIAAANGNQVVRIDSETAETGGIVYYAKYDEEGNITSIREFDTSVAGSFMIPEGYVQLKDVNNDAVIGGGEDGYVFYRIENGVIVRVEIPAGEIGYFDGDRYDSIDAAAGAIATEAEMVVTLEGVEDAVYYINGEGGIIKFEVDGTFIIPGGYARFENINPGAIIEGGEDGHVFYRIEGDKVVQVEIAKGGIGYFEGARYDTVKEAENAIAAAIAVTKEEGTQVVRIGEDEVPEEGVLVLYYVQYDEEGIDGGNVVSIFKLEVDAAGSFVIPDGYLPYDGVVNPDNIYTNDSDDVVTVWFINSEGALIQATVAPEASQLFDNASDFVAEPSALDGVLGWSYIGEDGLGFWSDGSSITQITDAGLYKLAEGATFIGKAVVGDVDDLGEGGNCIVAGDTDIELWQIKDGKIEKIVIEAGQTAFIEVGSTFVSQIAAFESLLESVGCPINIIDVTDEMLAAAADGVIYYVLVDIDGSAQVFEITNPGLVNLPKNARPLEKTETVVVSTEANPMYFKDENGVVRVLAPGNHVFTGGSEILDATEFDALKLGDSVTIDAANGPVYYINSDGEVIVFNQSGTFFVDGEIELLDSGRVVGGLVENGEVWFINANGIAQSATADSNGYFILPKGVSHLPDTDGWITVTTDNAGYWQVGNKIYNFEAGVDIRLPSNAAPVDDSRVIEYDGSGTVFYYTDAQGLTHKWEPEEGRVSGTYFLGEGSALMSEDAVVQLYADIEAGSAFKVTISAEDLLNTVYFVIDNKVYEITSAGEYYVSGLGDVIVGNSSRIVDTADSGRVSEHSNDEGTYFEFHYTDANGVIYKGTTNGSGLFVLDSGYELIDTPQADTLRQFQEGHYYDANGNVFYISPALALSGAYFVDVNAYTIVDSDAVITVAIGDVIFYERDGQVFRYEATKAGEFVLPMSAVRWNPEDSDLELQTGNGTGDRFFRDGEGTIYVISAEDTQGKFIPEDATDITGLVLTYEDIMAREDGQRTVNTNDDGEVVSVTFWFTSSADGRTYEVELLPGELYIFQATTEGNPAIRGNISWLEPDTDAAPPPTDGAAGSGWTTGTGGSGTSNGNLANNGNASNSSGIWFRPPTTNSDGDITSNLTRAATAVNLSNAAGNNNNPITALDRVQAYSSANILQNVDPDFDSGIVIPTIPQHPTERWPGTNSRPSAWSLSPTRTQWDNQLNAYNSGLAAYNAALADHNAAVAEAAYEAINDWAAASLEGGEWTEMVTTYSSWHLWGYVSMDRDTGMFTMEQVTDGTNIQRNGSVSATALNGTETNPSPELTATSDIIVKRFHNTPTLVVDVMSDITFTIVWKVSDGVYASMEISDPGTYYLQTFLTNGVDNYYWIGGGTLNVHPENGLLAEGDVTDFDSNGKVLEADDINNSQISGTTSLNPEQGELPEIGDGTPDPVATLELVDPETLSEIGFTVESIIETATGETETVKVGTADDVTVNVIGFEFGEDGGVLVDGGQIKIGFDENGDVSTITIEAPLSAETEEVSSIIPVTDGQVAINFDAEGNVISITIGEYEIIIGKGKATEIIIETPNDDTTEEGGTGGGTGDGGGDGDTEDLEFPDVPLGELFEPVEEFDFEPEFEVDLEFPDVPLAEFFVDPDDFEFDPDVDYESLVEMPVPLTQMPQTGLVDFTGMLYTGILLTTLVAAMTSHSIRRVIKNRALVTEQERLEQESLEQEEGEEV